MSASKEAEHLANSAQPSDPSPAYQAEAGPSSANEPSSDKIPTAENPFNFPSASPLPSYSEASSAKEPPIAIPQESPTQTSPFLKAYAPALLGHGITKEAWGSFLDTISAFMTAKVGERAINHAGDVAKNIGQQPVNYVKNVQNHAKSVGKNIAANTKRGNILGAAVGVVGGAISIPLGAVFGAVGTVVSLPARTIAAATRKPKTAAERAVAYVVVANHDWLNKRGLHASLVNTEQLSEVVGVSVKALLEASAEGDKSAGPLGPLSALSDHIAHLEVNGPGVVDIGAETWWLVLRHLTAMAPSPQAISGYLSSLFSLAGKVAVVTGGSSGIGREMAIALGRAGCRIVLVARRPKPLQDTIDHLADLHVTAEAIVADLSDQASVRDAIHAIKTNAGTPDILVNAAGVNYRPHMNDLSQGAWDETIAVNLTTPFTLGQAFGPKMAEKGWGRIINIISQQSFRAFGNSGAYGASKAGLLGLTRSQAEAWSKHGVLCNAIAPGLVDTPLARATFNDPGKADAHAARTMIGRNGLPKDFAGVAVWLASDASAAVTGQTIFVDGGYSST
ncbi:hypothetical protein LB504_011734 [Fusarium proliferatum]|nr:hypothetical protein LB504_011734 [Fusarium proliferatum]